MHPAGQQCEQHTKVEEPRNDELKKYLGLLGHAQLAMTRSMAGTWSNFVPFNKLPFCIPTWPERIPVTQQCRCAPRGRRTEMALHVLAYNLTRVMNIVGIRPLMAAIMA